MNLSSCFWACVLACISIEIACGQSEYRVVPRALRTKTGQIVPPTEFPPANSEQRLWGCLVSLDSINRKAVFRWEIRDRMVEVDLHPAAPLFYRGAPATLGDFPPQTMVEIWGYGDEQTDLPRNVLRLSDDFSVQSFAGRGYRVESVDMNKQTFTASVTKLSRSSPLLYQPQLSVGSSYVSEPHPSPIRFSFNQQTDWYMGDRIASSQDLAVGQIIQANFLRRFHEGPPLTTRCTEVWLDQASQDLATMNQIASFTDYLRDHGFPLRVDQSEDAKKLVTMTLLETGLESLQKEWQTEKNYDLSASTTGLRMWEPNGGQAGPDRMFGVWLKEKKETAIGYGCGGVTLTFSVPILYEAYRPGTIVKLYPAGHPVPILPIEERMPKEFDTFLRP